MNDLACKGYQLESCRRPRTSNSEFCSTCLFIYETSQMYAHIQQIQDPSISDEQILAFFETDTFISTLSTNLRWKDIMDKLLSTTYTRSPTLLHQLLKILQKSSQMNTNLILRITDHSKTCLCPVYKHMLIKKLSDENFHPRSCIRCMAYTISYSDTIIDTPSTKALILRDATRLLKWSLGNEKFFFDAVPFIHSLAESPRLSFEKDKLDKFVEELVKMAGSAEGYSPEDIEAFRKKVYDHPLILSQDVKSIKTFMKQKTAIWKVEWLAKSLHPSRVIEGWCHDYEELEEMKRDGFPIQHTPIKIENKKKEKAEWNISF